MTPNSLNQGVVQYVHLTLFFVWVGNAFALIILPIIMAYSNRVTLGAWGVIYVLLILMLANVMGSFYLYYDFYKRQKMA